MSFLDCLRTESANPIRNIGVWVGPQFFDAVAQSLPSAALQGVDASAYVADMHGYLVEGGSDAGAAALAQTVDAYVAACPQSSVVVSGWR